MKAFYIILTCTLCQTLANSQSGWSWSAFLQQPGIYYTSERVTAYGYGLGAGAVVDWNNGIAARADVNLLWGNGNLVATRLAAGYHKKGEWSPGIYATTTLLSGHKTEVLDDQGQRPPSVVWAIGFRILPLYFKGSKGYVSALELGYGFGDDHGQYAEITLFAAGIRL